MWKTSPRLNCHSHPYHRPLVFSHTGMWKTSPGLNCHSQIAPLHFPVNMFVIWEFSRSIRYLEPSLCFLLHNCWYHVLWLWRVHLYTLIEWDSFVRLCRGIRESEMWREAKNSHGANPLGPAHLTSSLSSSGRPYSLPPLGLLISYFFLAVMTLISPVHLLSRVQLFATP